VTRASERVEYPIYRTTLMTVNQNRITGKPGQSIDFVVMEHYGERAGFRPLHDPQFPNIVGVIVDPPSEMTQARRCEGELRPIAFTTHQVIRDWVLYWNQERVS